MVSCSLWKDCCRHIQAWLRWVRRRVMWIVLFVILGVRLMLAHTLITETGIHALHHGLMTAGFLFIGRLVWAALVELARGFAPAAP